MGCQLEADARKELLEQLDILRNELAGFDIVLEERFELEDRDLPKCSIMRLQAVIDHFDLFIA